MGWLDGFRCRCRDDANEAQTPYRILHPEATETLWLCAVVTSTSPNSYGQRWAMSAISSDAALAAAYRAAGNSAVTSVSELAVDLGPIIDQAIASRAAQGTEAGTAETEGLGPKDDGPVLEEDAPQ